MICITSLSIAASARKRRATEDFVRTKYLPQTEEQRFVVYDLTTAFFEQSLENPEERLCDEVLNPPPFDPLNLPIDDTEDDDYNLPQCPRPTTIARTTCSKGNCLIMYQLITCIASGTTILIDLWYP